MLRLSPFFYSAANKLTYNGEAERVGKEEGGTISGGTICTTLDEVPTPLDTKKCV